MKNRIVLLPMSNNPAPCRCLSITAHQQALGKIRGQRTVHRRGRSVRDVAGMARRLEHRIEIVGKEPHREFQRALVISQRYVRGAHVKRMIASHTDKCRDREHGDDAKHHQVRRLAPLLG